MKLTNRIREYIKCPQLNGTDYGRWGALTWEQRKLINELCEKCDIFEGSADYFAKGNIKLKEELGKQERESKTFRTLYNKALSFIIRLSMKYSFSKEELDEFCELQNYKIGE